MSLDGGRLTYRVAGRTTTGPALVMLDDDDDLLAQADPACLGYLVTPFLDPKRRSQLIDGLTDLVAATIARQSGVEPPGFTLAQYHHHVDDELHDLVIGDLFRQGLDMEQLPVDAAEVEAEVSRICGTAVTTHCHGLGRRVFCLRLVRPGSERDHNPPHRDVWLDHLRHGLNAYVPLAGSTSRSSLALVPRSHRWPESDIERTVDGARIDGHRYDVPAVTGARQGIALVRPNPGPDEILLFSPYLVHGGSRNEEPRTSRVSLELRFWRS